MSVRIEKRRPITPGTRFRTDIKDSDLHKGRPHPGLVKSKKRISCRNNQGHITVRRRGGGHKRLYRIIDFKRDKDNIPAIVERIEYDPNRSANIALLLYKDGERRYIIAPNGVKAGMELMSGENAPLEVGNTLCLKDIQQGTTVHCIEMKPGKGAQMARTAGASAQIKAKDGAYVTLMMPSGETRKILAACRATIGEVGKKLHSLRKRGKAGASRHLGRRPTVRGVAMNPVDHAMGGGEGRTSGGRHPCSPSGKPTKGYKTRKKSKPSNKYIVRDRRKN